MKKIFMTIPALIFLLSGCGEVKTVTEESKIAQEAFGVAAEIREAYVKKDLSTIEKNSTKDGYRQILISMKKFDSADLVFTYKWVDINQTIVTVKVAWKGTWMMSGQQTEEQGTALFVFEGKPLLLSRIRNANPFLQPE